MPFASNEEFTTSILNNVYEGLTEMDESLGLRPGLAESWHTPDDVTWVFRLREGVHPARDPEVDRPSSAHPRTWPGRLVPQTRPA